MLTVSCLRRVALQLETAEDIRQIRRGTAPVEIRECYSYVEEYEEQVAASQAEAAANGQTYEGEVGATSEGSDEEGEEGEEGAEANDDEEGGEEEDGEGSGEEDDTPSPAAKPSNRALTPPPLSQMPRRRLPPAPRPHPPSKTPRMSVTNPRRFRRADPTPSPPPTIAVEPPPQSSSQAVEEDTTDQLPAEAEDPQADSSEYRPRKF